MLRARHILCVLCLLRRLLPRVLDWLLCGFTALCRVQRGSHGGVLLLLPVGGGLYHLQLGACSVALRQCCTTNPRAHMCTH